MAAVYPDLAGQVVLITGGASGIGEAIVRHFARQKSTSSSSISRTRRVPAWRKSFPAGAFGALSACRPDRYLGGVAQARTAHGPTQILINNAAHDERHAAEDVTPDYWDDRIAVNLKHQFFAAQAVLPVRF
jgi:NAD(P)-dependent dehydrogenase (short-subunit alcohol dehydrogenase family)